MTTPQLPDAARKRFLIVVGLPKAGTTFLYAQAAKRPDRFALPVGDKEVDFFRRSDQIDTYLGLFDGGAAGGRVYVDASPRYIDDLDLSLGNMTRALAGHDVRIVVCLRDPLERAYSHYLHDVAMHQKINGHADYAFWSPTVMAKYLIQLEPRIARLQEVFGADRVHGFAFGTDMTRFEAMLRGFAGLEPEWSLNISENPAPGFTCPQCYYNGDHDMEVPLQGGIHILPAGHLLVVNRAFSIYRPNIHRPLAEQIVLRQASLTRQFDTAMLSDATRARIYDDTAAAARRLGLEMPLDPAPRVLQAQTSDNLPAEILDQLRPLCSFEEAVNAIFDKGTQRANATIVQMPYVAPSLARDMARMALALVRDPAEPLTPRALQQLMVDTYGPIPLYIERLMNWEVAQGNYDRAVELFAPYGGPAALLWPMDVAQFLRARGQTLPADVAHRFMALGIEGTDQVTEEPAA